MSRKILKVLVNNAISSENSSDVKEEFQDEYYADNKICVSEATITDTNNELNAYIKNDKIRKSGMFFVNHIKTDLASSEVNDTESNYVKIENGICPSDIQIKFDNELMFCSHCQEVYQYYCTECRVLIHILNESYNTYNSIRELPKYVLESRESFGHLGIFSLKVIPENVRFGPLTGLNSMGLSLRIKGGRFLTSDDKSEVLNWMQYVNPARNIYEQNLFPFQYEGKLYYCSTRRIQEGEELLVYFGVKYEDNLLENVQMDFVPITKSNVETVFACTFCCLGFSSKEYLAEHKAARHSEMNEMSTVEELAQCPFCKIYLEAKEYFKHHKDYCCETNAICLVKRDCAVPSTEVHKLETERRSSLRSKAKRWKRGIYKCTQCKFRTMYNADFRYHTNEHYEVKMYKCGICRRRYKARKSLETHMVKIHGDTVERDLQNYSKCDSLKANINNMKARSARSHGDEKQYPFAKYKIQTRKKCHLKSQIKRKYLNRGKYKCLHCEFKTYYRSYLDMHTKMKHLMENYYKCRECEYQTNIKSYLEVHTKMQHKKQKDYKCAECEYKTNHKGSLTRHIKAVHLKIRNLKCAECEYKTNSKYTLENHIKTKHLKISDYKCTECEYKTNNKYNIGQHIKTQHSKICDYKCAECEYKTNNKSHFGRHVNGRHLKIVDYKCAECDYKADYKQNLEDHMKTIHSKVTYKCAECEFKTNYKSSLEKHINRVHLKVRDYKCVECEYKTYCKSSLRVHVKIKHLKLMNYKCEECEYKTNYKSCFKIHLKSKHLKERDYKCPECEYMTNYKSDLVGHIKTKHLEEYDYKCAECEFKTYRKSNFQKHLKVVHPKVIDYKCAM